MKIGHYRLSNLDIFLIAGSVIMLIWLALGGPDELATEQAQYCGNVKTGHWPDYRHVYDTECDKILNENR